MSVTFDGINKLIIAQSGTTMLDVGADLYSRWKDWAISSDNAKYEQAFRVVGGDPTVGGNTIAGYFFLTNGWKLRPQEANHTLTIDGILLDDGGGDPYVSTLGTFNVRINATIPLQAEAIIVETGTSGLTSTESSQLATLTDIKAKTDQLTFTVPNHLDVNAEYMNSAKIIGNGLDGNSWRGVGVIP